MARHGSQDDDSANRTDRPTEEPWIASWNARENDGSQRATDHLVAESPGTLVVVRVAGRGALQRAYSSGRKQRSAHKLRSKAVGLSSPSLPA